MVLGHFSRSFIQSSFSFK